MGSWFIRYALLGIAAIPFIYYIIALVSAWRFFRHSADSPVSKSGFTPPVSILKPVRGLDPDAYDHFASFTISLLSLARGVSFAIRPIHRSRNQVSLLPLAF